MANLFDLTPQAFAALRVPAATAAVTLSIGFCVAWWLRKRGHTWAPNIVAAFAMLAFFHSANLAFAAFEPRLSSRPLADELLKWLQPEDRLVIYGEFEAGSSLSFYARRQAWIYNGRYNGLEFGSYLSDAPAIFLRTTISRAPGPGRPACSCSSPRRSAPGLSYASPSIAPTCSRKRPARRCPSFGPCFPTAPAPAH